MQNNFINAIYSKNKVKVTFYSKEDGRNLVRLCAPMDFGPSRRAHNKSDRFHMWDYESDQKNHVLGLLPEQVVNIEVQPAHFDPSEFVTWQPNWLVARDWAAQS
ncbi:MAG: hypothetical protein ACJAYB_000531 [Psychromonas sp.]|jgi:hypothetical protein